MSFSEEENRKRLLQMREAGYSSGQYGQGYGYQGMNQPVRYNAFQQGYQAAQGYGYQAQPMTQPVQYNAFHQNSFRHQAPQNAQLARRISLETKVHIMLVALETGGEYLSIFSWSSCEPLLIQFLRYEPRSIPTQYSMATPSASSKGENVSPSGPAQIPIATASPSITAIAKPVEAASSSITSDAKPVEAASTPITPPTNPVPYQPFPEPDVPFFKKIGAYTLVVIEPSDHPILHARIAREPPSRFGWPKDKWRRF
jgi:hypothetical protein